MKKLIFLLLGTCLPLMAQFSFSVRLEPKLPKFNKIMVKKNDVTNIGISLHTKDASSVNGPVQSKKYTFKLDKANAYTVFFLDTTAGSLGHFERYVRKLEVKHGDVLKLAATDLKTPDVDFAESPVGEMKYDPNAIQQVGVPEIDSNNKTAETKHAPPLEDKIELIVDEKAKANEDLVKYIKTNFAPRLKAQADTLRGRFNLVFIVEKDGIAALQKVHDMKRVDMLSNIEDRGFVEEIERLVVAFNKTYTWTPALKQGKAVKSKAVINLVFGRDQ